MFRSFGRMKFGKEVLEKQRFLGGQIGDKEEIAKFVAKHESHYYASPTNYLINIVTP